MDVITIRDLEVECRVGVTAEERSRTQRLTLTIELECDTRSAAETDDLTRTIDYDALSRRVSEVCSRREWRLIETLAHELAAVILDEFQPAKVTIEVKKFVIPKARYVSVRISRARPHSNDRP